MSASFSLPRTLAVPGLLVVADVGSRAAARAWLRSSQIDLGGLTLLLRIHRGLTFFPAVPLAPLFQAVLIGALVGVLVAVGIGRGVMGRPQHQTGALLAACGGIVNGVELWCCGVTDLFGVSVFGSPLAVFNLGDVNLVVGLVLLLITPSATSR